MDSGRKCLWMCGVDGDVEPETYHLMVKPLSPWCLAGASRGLCASIKGEPLEWTSDCDVPGLTCCL